MSNIFEVTFTDGQITHITADQFFSSSHGAGITFQENTPADDEFSYPQSRNVAWFPTERVTAIREIVEVTI